LKFVLSKSKIEIRKFLNFPLSRSEGDIPLLLKLIVAKVDISETEQNIKYE